MVEKAERTKNTLKSAGAALWNKIKAKRSSKALNTTIKSILAASVAGGLAVGAIGYTQANEAKKELKTVNNILANTPSADQVNAQVQGVQRQVTAAQTTATDAQTAATQAQTSADKAQVSANTAQGVATSAQTKADAAQKTADSATVNAAEAQATANTAKTNAAAAQATADQATQNLIAVQNDLNSTQDQVTAAQTTANNATAAASNAQAAAVSAQTTADAAKTAAANAQAAAVAAQATADQAKAAAATAQAAADAAQASANQALAAAQAAAVRLPVIQYAAATVGGNGLITAPSGITYDLGTQTFDGTSQYYFQWSMYRTGFATHCSGGILVNGSATDPLGKPYPVLSSGFTVDDYQGALVMTNASVATPPAGPQSVQFKINSGGNCKYSDIILTIQKVG